MTRIEKAIDLFNKGFYTKADQKRCLELISRHYEGVHTTITHGLLKLRDENKMANDENFDALYWGIPYSLHQIRPKHSDMFSDLFPNEVKEIEYLVKLRNEVKSAPILKFVSETKEMEEKVERIEKSLKEIFQHNMDMGNYLLKKFQLIL